MTLQTPPTVQTVHKTKTVQNLKLRPVGFLKDQRVYQTGEVTSVGKKTSEVAAARSQLILA